MRKITVVLCGLALALGVLTPSSAAASEAALPNCRHHLGDGEVRSANNVVHYELHTRIGSVQLCKDSAERFWGYLVLDNEMPSRRWANVYIQTYYNGDPRGRYSCDADGGNDHIIAGETMCWTPKIYGTDERWTYLAFAYAYYESAPDVWRAYADGYTKLPWYR